MAKKSIAIIGAGLSGLVCAKALSDHAAITIFEKARGVGGRMSTRYADPYQFDHGAQYFTARTKEFQNFLKPLIEAGVIAAWTPKVVTLEAGEKPYKREWFEPHYVAVPKMNSLCKMLAQDQNLHLQTRITVFEKEKEKWILKDEEGETHGPFDLVTCSAPAMQVSDLMPKNFSSHAILKSVRMLACYSLMLGFKDMPKLNWQAAAVKNSPIGWMAINSSKPGREETAPSILIQTTNEWGERHIDDDNDEVQEILLREFEKLTGIAQENISHTAIHGWRYASVDQALPDDQNYIFDAGNNLAVCGDWCVEGKIEGAFVSAYALSQKLKSIL